LEKDPVARFGADEVLKSAFLRDISTKALLKKEVKMPYRPVVINGIGDLNCTAYDGAADSRGSSMDVQSAAFAGFCWMPR
jgi:hypothetical protein